MRSECFLFHKWNGCRCSRCGKVRDNKHEWGGCMCSRCGKKRFEQHEWDLCKGECIQCGAKNIEKHEWKGCMCSRCGKKRDEQHKWDESHCSRCGIERDEKKESIREFYAYIDEIMAELREVQRFYYNSGNSIMSTMINNEITGLGIQIQSAKNLWLFKSVDEIKIIMTSIRNDAESLMKHHSSYRK
jgi:hypothetical protein